MALTQEQTDVEDKKGGNHKKSWEVTTTSPGALSSTSSIHVLDQGIYIYKPCSWYQFKTMKNQNRTINVKIIVSVSVQISAYKGYFELLYSYKTWKFLCLPSSTSLIWYLFLNIFYQRYCSSFIPDIDRKQIHWICVLMYQNTEYIPV